MPLRTSHGAGKASAIVRVETMPADEALAGVAAGACGPSDAAAADAARGMVGSDAAARKAAASTLAKRRWARERERGPRLALLAGLGLQGVTPELLAPYLKAADEFSEAERTRLARVVGGGVCEGSAALLVDAAALATAASRAAYAAGEAALGARLSAEARSNLLGAHELCAREAKSRPRAQPAWMAEIGIAVDTPGTPTPTPEPERECRHSEPSRASEVKP